MGNKIDLTGQSFNEWTVLGLERNVIRGDGDNIEMPRMDNIDLPELTFDLEDFSAESLFKAIGIEPDAPPKPMEIRIQGKRIWWKPWHRRPDKKYIISLMLLLGLLMMISWRL